MPSILRSISSARVLDRVDRAEDDRGSNSSSSKAEVGASDGKREREREREVRVDAIGRGEGVGSFTVARLQDLPRETLRAHDAAVEVEALSAGILTESFTVTWSSGSSGAAVVSDERSVATRGLLAECGVGARPERADTLRADATDTLLRPGSSDGWRLTLVESVSWPSVWLSSSSSIFTDSLRGSQDVSKDVHVKECMNNHSHGRRKCSKNHRLEVCRRCCARSCRGKTTVADIAGTNRTRRRKGVGWKRRRSGSVDPEWRRVPESVPKLAQKCESQTQKEYDKTPPHSMRGMDQ